jgi:RNA polymerase sigma factor (sigma-70 family)
VGALQGVVIDAVDDFDRFVSVVGARLRRVLIAHHGVEVGNDATDEALAYAWEHWGRVQVMDNPAGYLYRVASSSARRHRRWRRTVDLPFERTRPDEPSDPGLHTALATLTPPQRVCVVLVHVYDWTYDQTAEVTGYSVAAVTNHVHRGLRGLRRALGEPS